MKVVANTKDMSREDWLEARGKGIGGSDIGTILGVNKYKSVMELYLEKTGQIQNKVSNDAIYWGNRLEHIVAEEFAIQSGKKVRNKNAIIQHKYYPFMLANVDRMIVGEKAVLECKTTGSHNFKQWVDDEVPASYILQCQWYLAVLGDKYKTAYIACLIGGQRFVWKEIKRDNQLIGMMIRAAKDFWENHVLTMTPPAVDDSQASSDLLGRLYPTSLDDSETELDEEADRLIEQYKEAAVMVKQWENHKRLTENKLKEKLGEFERGQASEYVVSWKSVTSNRVDSNKLKEQFPEVYKQVVKESNSRRFSIK